MPELPMNEADRTGEGGWREQTLEHCLRVRQLLWKFAERLCVRGIAHDASKFESLEAETFATQTQYLKGYTYGSEEYEAQRKGVMGEALKHHYRHNDHHPEHFDDGIMGMDLVQLLEMLCDWKASSLRHADGDIRRSLVVGMKRWDIPMPLAVILWNTISRYLAPEEDLSGELKKALEEEMALERDQEQETKDDASTS